MTRPPPPPLVIWNTRRPIIKEANKFNPQCQINYPSVSISQVTQFTNFLRSYPIGKAIYDYHSYYWIYQHWIIIVLMCNLLYLASWHAARIVAILANSIRSSSQRTISAHLACHRFRLISDYNRHFTNLVIS